MDVNEVMSIVNNLAQEVIDKDAELKPKYDALNEEFRLTYERCATSIVEICKANGLEAEFYNYTKSPISVSVNFKKFYPEIENK